MTEIGCRYSQEDSLQMCLDILEKSNMKDQYELNHLEYLLYCGPDLESPPPPE